MKIALAWVDRTDPTDRSVAEPLARELLRRGHDVCFVGPRRRPREPFLSKAEGVPYYRVGPSKARAERQLAEIAAREGVDVWHVHVFGREHEALAAAARQGGWKVLVTPHLVLKDYLRFTGGAAGLRRLLSRAGRIACVSRAARKEFLSLFPEWKGRTSIVYNGTRALSRSARAPRGQRRPYLLCVARLAPYKGQDLLLMAFARLLETHPDSSLVLCGRDQTNGGLKRLARALGLGRRVVWMGDVEPGAVDTLLRGCEAFVLPSRRENLPLAVLEAMSAGKAVLACGAGGVRELIRNDVDGLLVPPNDVAALTRGLERLADDPGLRRRLGRAAKIRSRDFDWGRAAEAYLRLYERLGSSRRSSAGMRSKK